jgi:hypothetical protein
LLIPLVLLGWKNYKLRLFVLATSVLVYATYPILLRVLGGTYNNFAIGYRRLYVWVIDAYFNQEFVSKVNQFLNLYLKNFPIIPIIIGLIVMLLFHIILCNSSVHGLNSCLKVKDKQLRGSKFLMIFSFYFLFHATLGDLYITFYFF